MDTPDAPDLGTTMHLFDPTEPESTRSAPQTLRTAGGLLALMRHTGIGPARAIALATTFSSPAALAAATRERLRTVAGKTAEIFAAGEITVDPVETAGDLYLVGYFDDAFPAALRTIPDPPAVLWVRGTLPPADVVAIVGTRRVNAWGEAATKACAGAAVDAGYGVVSGLALGVDTLAHQGTIDHGGVTWAVLGGGVDRPEPAANRRLADEILATGGGLLAEVPPGTRPAARTLVARNRLQSGLGRATIIPQTGAPGGTLHTARFTLEQERLLAVLAPPPRGADDPGFAGNVALTNPAGCDPKILSAAGKTADRIARRRPVADIVVHSADDLATLWDALGQKA